MHNDVFVNFLNRKTVRSMVKFGYTIIYVSDVKKTTQFYKNAFSIPVHFIDDSEQFAQMDTGDTKLAFATNALAETNFSLKYYKNDANQMPPGIEIVLIFDDVKSAFKQAIKMGAKEMAPPAFKPWGQLVAYVRDLNGFIVELASPM